MEGLILCAGELIWYFSFSEISLLFLIHYELSKIKINCFVTVIMGDIKDFGKIKPPLPSTQTAVRSHTLLGLMLVSREQRLWGFA